MSRKSLIARMFGAPLLVILLFMGMMAPRYVPSDSLVSAAASTTSPDLAKERMIASFVGYCRKKWDFDRLRTKGVANLYSLENDAGLLARTSVTCLPGGQCSVEARALVHNPFPAEIGGKPLPRKIWGCGQNTPDWTRENLSG